MDEKQTAQRRWIAAELTRMEERYASAPTAAQMPRRTLADKGIDGPTAAHAVEEVHVPLNYAYITFTTGSSAMQTPVAVVPEEIPRRAAAGREALRRAGIASGCTLLVTYAPLVNVFSADALREYGVGTRFLRRSCRESLLSAWAEGGAGATIGESSFLRSALEDAVRMGLAQILPEKMTLLAAGTPLDPELPEILKQFPGWELHDLYGCQEFGWLTLDGEPLRPDIVLFAPEEEPEAVCPVVGGIPVGDCFRKGRHRLNPEKGLLATHSRIPALREWETWITEAPVQEETMRRAAKSILRIKSRVVRLAPDAVCGSSRLAVRVVPAGGNLDRGLRLEETEQLWLLWDLIEAQKNMQASQKRDGAWHKAKDR